MKKRNYVVAISMIALLVQSGSVCAMEVQGGGSLHEPDAQKATAVKGATFDSLYKRAKEFVKEMKTLKRCHKDKSCTPEQYQKIKRAGWAIATAAAALVGAALLAAGVTVYQAQTLEGRIEWAKSRWLNRSNEKDMEVLRLFKLNSPLELESGLENALMDVGTSQNAFKAVLWLIEMQRYDDKFKNQVLDVEKRCFPGSVKMRKHED